MKRLLYIAPHREGLLVLAADQELENLRASVPSGALDITVLKGEVRLNDFALILAAANARWDIILFVAHGMPGRIAFTDQDATPQWLASLLRLASPTTVLLSTCYSGVRDVNTLKNLAEEISNSGINTVAAIRELDDQAAVCFDVEFVRARVLGCTYSESMEIALERAAELNQSFPNSVIQVPAVRPAVIASYAEIMGTLILMRDDFAQIVKQLDDLTNKVETQHGKASEALAEVQKALASLTIDHDLQSRMMRLLELSQGALLAVTENRAGVPPTSARR